MIRFLLLLFAPCCCFGACLSYTAITFEGGVDGAAMSTNALLNSTFGAGGWWGFNNQNLSFSTAAQKPLVSAIDVCTVGSVSGSGTIGFKALQTANSFYSPLEFHPTGPQNRMSAGVWINHSFPFTNDISYDIFTIYNSSGNQFCNAKLIQAGTQIGMYFTMETPAGGGPDIYAPYIKANTYITNGLWYWVTLKYDTVSSGTNMQIEVYDSALTLVERLQCTTSTSASASDHITLGVQNHGDLTPGLAGVCGVLYDSMIVDAGSNPDFPLMPTGSGASSSTTSTVSLQGNISLQGKVSFQ